MNASLGSGNLIRADSVPRPRKCLSAYRVGTRVIGRYTKAQIFNNILFLNVCLHVNEYTYLGVRITKNGNHKPENNDRINRG